MSKSHANNGWPSDAPTPAQITEFFKQIKSERITKTNLQEFLRGQKRMPNDDMKIIPVPFDTVGFLEGGWKILSEETDGRVGGLTIDFGKANFVTCLEIGEIFISGGVRLRRLKESKDIRLGATVFMGFWNDYKLNKKKSVLEKLYQSNVIKGYIDFFGTILLSPDGIRYVLYLSRRRNGVWDWGMRSFGDNWGISNLTAVYPID